MTAATPQCELLVQFLSSAVSGFENNLSDSRDDSTGLKVSCSPDGNWKSSNGEKVEKNGNVVCRTQGLLLQFLRRKCLFQSVHTVPIVRDPSRS